MKSGQENKRDTQKSLSFIVDNMVMNKDFDRLEKKVDSLEAKIDGVSNTLANFEKHEVDRRLQLDVRVGSIEKHLNIKPTAGTISS